MLAVTAVQPDTPKQQEVSLATGVHFFDLGQNIVG